MAPFLTGLHEDKLTCLVERFFKIPEVKQTFCWKFSILTFLVQSVRGLTITKEKACQCKLLVSLICFICIGISKRTLKKANIVCEFLLPGLYTCLIQIALFLLK